ncbi:MAG: hypothetical protein A3K19_15370 [Lentisphaerae bacterium RIFOXYB12_FULL_65_16]|nr:MAG: hypothetical protein A3K18_29155 [Lentisphaerae bacterium RIFOXYA12_64_32]OGV88479.1 MAG: hypothetical protein A3K19_15370 [Lentisphaerae bacterium RIFOXYB12_FULL_65_16]
MRDSRDNAQNRREFLRDCGRAGILGGLGLAVLMLGRTGRIAADETPATCPTPCADCARLDGCALPRAVAARQNPYEKRHRHHG